MKQRFYFVCLMLFALAAMVLLPELDAALQLDNSNADALLMATGPTFAALKWDIGRNNMGGYKGYLLYVPEDAVATMPVVPEPSKATNNKEFVTAAGAFAFTSSAAVKAPLYMYSTDGEVGYTAEQQGETDGISYKCTLEFFFPGSTPELHAFAALVKNTRGFYVFEDVDGQQFLLGQPGLPCTTVPSFNGGKKRSDRRGMSFKATCDSNYSAILMGTPIDIRKAGGYEAAGIGG